MTNLNIVEIVKVAGIWGAIILILVVLGFALLFRILPRYIEKQFDREEKKDRICAEMAKEKAAINDSTQILLVRDFRETLEYITRTNAEQKEQSRKSTEYIVKTFTDEIQEFRGEMVEKRRAIADLTETIARLDEKCHGKITRKKMKEIEKKKTKVLS